VKVSSLASFAVGVQMLRSHPLRTLLSTLGIIIGVASLVAILSLGDGLERYSRAQIEGTTDLQSIQIEPRTTDRVEDVLVRRDPITTLDGDDAAQLETALAGRARVLAHLTGSAIVRAAPDTAAHAALISALDHAAPGIMVGNLIAGRFLENGDARAGNVAVITRRMAQDLGSTPEHGIGREILVGSQTRRVVGVVSGPAAGTSARVYLPMDDAARHMLADGGRRTPALAVLVSRIEDVPAVEAASRAWLEDQFGNVDRNFTIASSRMRVQQVRQGMLVFKLALGAITGISILVGGIGIMNVLLASVHERTREIGVRRASGARRSDIFLQFLAESMAVSGVGSIIGVMLGLGGAFLITALIRQFTQAQLYAAFTWTTVLFAAASAILVGIAFGSYPANLAARLSPIEAIRHE
jgi:putative ABC transport system permease protein